MNNNLLLEEENLKYTKVIQEKQQLYFGQKSKKLTRSIRLEEEKLEIEVTTQPKRALKKEDFSISTLDSWSSKRLQFLSLQKLHISRVGMTFHMASFDCPYPYIFLHRSISTTLLGMTHETPNKVRTKFHISLVNSQWKKRWFTVSSLFLQRQHQLQG
jgi:hypothetical protein